MLKLLYLVSEDWYFCSHRLPLAIAARDAGYDVTVATRVSQEGERIRDAGLQLSPLSLSRKSTNPVSELAAFIEIVKLYRAVRPTIVHHVAMKPVLYGSLAARIVGVPIVVNAIAGLGYVFSSNDLRARAMRPFVRLAYRNMVTSRRSCVIVQNPEDQMLLEDLRMAPPEQLKLIRGSGVDVDAFSPVPEPAGIPIVALPARMLRDKGVHEFVGAARLARVRNISARFVLIGEPDPDNPSSIAVEQLESWRRDGVVEWWGWRHDMAQVLKQCNVVCLPSYREGLPKVLLEAAASGRAIITCDVPGCREVVRHGDNGLLVPARNVSRLAEAIERLVSDRELREKMGQSGRTRAEQEFSIASVIRETLDLYQKRLAEIAPIRSRPISTT